MDTDPLAPLPEAFYQRPVLRLARALLGCQLVRRGKGRLRSGRVIEVEAYGGRLDPAAHTYRGSTPRCATMFGPPGRLYVYFTYGNHHCANVTGGDGCAVLLRAVTPEQGLPGLRAARAAACSSRARADALGTGQLDRELTNGPGKLTAAFGLDLGHDGTDLTRGEALWLTAGRPARRVAWTPRIGLGKNPAAGWLWRCVDLDAVRDVTRTPASLPRQPRPVPTLAQLRRQAASDGVCE